LYIPFRICRFKHFRYYSKKTSNILRKKSKSGKIVPVCGKRSVWTKFTHSMAFNHKMFYNRIGFQTTEGESPKWKKLSRLKEVIGCTDLSASADRKMRQWH